MCDRRSNGRKYKILVYLIPHSKKWLYFRPEWYMLKPCMCVHSSYQVPQIGIDSCCSYLRLNHNDSADHMEVDSRLCHLRRFPMIRTRLLLLPCSVFWAPQWEVGSRVTEVGLHGTQCLGGVCSSFRRCSFLPLSGGKRTVFQPAIGRGERHALRYW